MQCIRMPWVRVQYSAVAGLGLFRPTGLVMDGGLLQDVGNVVGIDPAAKISSSPCFYDDATDLPFHTTEDIFVGFVTAQKVAITASRNGIGPDSEVDLIRQASAATVKSSVP